jgi:hypothetical protein
MALLMLSTLLTLSTRNLVNYDFGFDARRMLSASSYFPRGRDTLSDVKKEALLKSSMR